MRSGGLGVLLSSSLDATRAMVEPKQNLMQSIGWLHEFPTMVMVLIRDGSITCVLSEHHMFNGGYAQ